MKRDWLSDIRKSKKLTQQYVASRSFIDRSFYSHIESGKRNPSLSVARYISAVLDFDPMMFFLDAPIKDSPEDPNSKIDLYKLLYNMGNGHILYLYNNFNCYLNHATIFTIVGVCTNSSCLIIDTPSNFQQIRNSLEKTLSGDEIASHINLINKEKVMEYPPESLCNSVLEELSVYIEGKNSIFLWCHVRRDHPNDWIFKNQLELLQKNKKIITLHSYDASILTAHTYIELMRKVPYLMTDNEIIDSPLYQLNRNTTIYPSLYLQDDA